MKATLINKENGEAKFTLEFTAEEFDNAQIEVYKKTKGEYHVDGFREGKAPRSIIEKKYGETVFVEEAINNLFRDAYPEAIDELKLEVIEQPRVEMGKIAKNEPFTATFTATIYPEIVVENYKGVEIEKAEAKLEDGDVEKAIDEMRDRNARMVDVDREVKKGDTIIFDYKGFVGDEQFEGGTAENHELEIGSGAFIPGFEDQLVGAEKEKEIEVKVTFPEEYHADNLAGKDAIFKCVVHEIKEKQVPELDDEFVKDISEFDTVEELEKDVEDKLMDVKKLMAVEKMKDDIIGVVYESHEIEVPASMVETEIDVMMQEVSNNMLKQGMQLQMYLEQMGKTMADFRADMKDDAAKSVKTRMILRAIREAENIEAEQTEIDDQIEKLAANYKMDKEQLVKAAGPDFMTVLKEDIEMRKTVDLLYNEAVIK